MGHTHTYTHTHPVRIGTPNAESHPSTSAHWAGQFPFNSALAMHRSPFLTLSRSSRPSGVHSPLRPGLDVLPTSRLRLGERFHSGKGGSLKTAAVITVIISSSLLFSRGGAFRPHLHPGRGSVCAAAFGTRVPGAGVRGPERPSSRRCRRGLDSCRHSRSCTRVGVPGRCRGTGKCSQPTSNNPTLTEVCSGWSPHFRRRPSCRGPGGPRAAEPGFRPRRQRPTWSRAGSRARKPAQTRAPSCQRLGPALRADPPVCEVGTSRIPILQKKKLRRLPSELSADWTWHPHPPTRAHSYPSPPVRTPPSLLDHALSSHAKSLGEQQLGETRGGHSCSPPRSPILHRGKLRS